MGEQEDYVHYAISACLLGENCKYNGGNNINAALLRYMRDKAFITICPEVLGGLGVPRAKCEICQDQVMDIHGHDCTAAFYSGAKKALAKVKAFNVDIIIVQSRSPSCGKGVIYDGSFRGTLVHGDGIFVHSAQKEGICVMDVETFLKQTAMEEAQ